MRHYVHAWDPVPRVPWCQKWVENVIPRYKAQLIKPNEGVACSQLLIIPDECVGPF